MRRALGNLSIYLSTPSARGPVGPDTVSHTVALQSRYSSSTTREPYRYPHPRKDALSEVIFSSLSCSLFYNAYGSFDVIIITLEAPRKKVISLVRACVQEWEYRDVFYQNAGQAGPKINSRFKNFLIFL